MSWGWCDNPREHERQAERDFERGGRYGYDRDRYAYRYEDECNRVYMEKFEDLRREEERREEERQDEKYAARRERERVEQHRQDDEWEERRQEEEERP